MKTSETNDIFIQQLKKLCKEWGAYGIQNMKDQREMFKHYPSDHLDKRDALVASAGMHLGLEKAKYELLKLIEMAEVVRQQLEDHRE